MQYSDLEKQLLLIEFDLMFNQLKSKDWSEEKRERFYIVCDTLVDMGLAQCNKRSMYGNYESTISYKKGSLRQLLSRWFK